MTIWGPKQRFSVSAQYCPAWEKPCFLVSENGGRHAHECLDINVAVWRCTASLTIWGLGRLAALTRHLPSHPSGRGYTLGWWKP